MSNSDPRLHFSLGSAEKVESIEVRWLGGQTEIVENIPANQFVTIRQGAGVVETKRFKAPR